MPRAQTHLYLLLAAALALYLVGNASVALLDRDEPRYAQASRQMLQTGDWVVPRFLDKLRAKKPPFIYWAQASSMRVLGDNAFAARLPSAVAVFLTAVLLSAFLYRFSSPQHAFWTTLVFCSSALTVVVAKSCLTDGVLLLWTVIAQLCLYAMWRGKNTCALVVLFSIAIALGLLTKVLIVGFVLATLLVLWAFRLIDSRRRIPPLQPAIRLQPSSLQLILYSTVGLAIVVALVGPWLYLVHHRAPEFLLKMRTEAAGHALGDMEGHGGPPGVHLLLIWADFLPWSLFLPAVLVSAWRNRRQPHIRFALAAAIGPWLFVELAIRTKLPHYMLPTLPPLAFLTADAIVRSLRGQRPDLSAAPLIRAGYFWAAALIAITLAPWLAVAKFHSLPFVAMTLLTLFTAAWTLLAILLLRHWHTARAMLTIGLGMMISCSIFYGLYLPRAQILRLSVLAADVLKQHGAVGPDSSAMIDYKEPSLAFYQGGSIREKDNGLIESADLPNWKPWMVITQKLWDQSPPKARQHLQIIARFRGVSPADGMKTVEVLVVRKK